MTTYADTMVKSKEGLNYIRTIVEASECIFHKIEQENDLGIDALIEFTNNGVPQNLQIAIQIKSGDSYYKSQTEQCIIPIGNHYDYWINHSLPVYGIVYIPSRKSANWVNIKDYLTNNNPIQTIMFQRTKVNIFNLTAFTKFFRPILFKNLPDLTYNEAIIFANSNIYFECILGLNNLFSKWPNRLKIWDIFFTIFKSKDIKSIPPVIISYFAHIPWHGDIFYTGETINDDTKDHVNKQFNTFKKIDVVKLLSFIDDENMITRGSIGQSVEAIISSLPNCDELLIDIVKDSNIPMFLRECAILIFTYRNQLDSLPLLNILCEQGSWYAGELTRCLDENGWIDPYA